MTKEIWYTYEEPEIYDGDCAIIYTDSTYKLISFIVKGLPQEKIDWLKKRIETFIKEKERDEKS